MLLFCLVVRRKMKVLEGVSRVRELIFDSHFWNFHENKWSFDGLFWILWVTCPFPHFLGVKKRCKNGIGMLHDVQAPPTEQITQHKCNLKAASTGVPWKLVRLIRPPASSSPRIYRRLLIRRPWRWRRWRRRRLWRPIFRRNQGIPSWIRHFFLLNLRGEKSRDAFSLF